AEVYKVEVPYLESQKASPDGGFGWVVVALSFMVAFIVFGFAYTYSLLVDHYHSTSGPFEGKRKSLEYVGTINIAVLDLSCLVTGRIDDWLGHRRCILAGAFFYTAGLLLSSFATKVWHLLFTQGVMLGVGGSLLTISTISAPMEWFDKWRGLASGLSMSGCGLGGMVLAPLSTKLLDVLPIETLLCSFAALACLILVLAAWAIRDQPRVDNKDEVAWYDCSIIKNPKFLIILFGNTVATFGYLVPLYKMSEYTAAVGLTKEEASYILSCINGSSSASRVVGGILADYFGATNTLVASLLVMALTCSFQWPLSQNINSLLAYGLIFGFGLGGFVSLPPVVNSKLFGIKGLSTNNGWLYFTAAFPALMGVPAATALIPSHPTVPKDFLLAIQYAGITAFMGAAFFFWLKLYISHKPFARV
ncbi:hypothetical protein L0F63_002336, partial [Massospora cicadina]